MPDSSGEPYARPFLHNRPSLSESTLPFHETEQTHHLQNQRRRLQSEQGTELQHINTQSTTPFTHQDESSPSSEDESEQDPLVSDGPSNNQMLRRSRKNKTKPDLHINTNGHANGHANGHVNGHANGHANGEMNSNIEMRRKHHASSNDPASAKETAMSRDDFSLDNEPPPPLTPQTPALVNASFSDLPVQDQRNFLLLVVLYFLQGIPMGLAGGSVPFLLKKYLSYGQIGVFSLAIYPYSLKLLWSPIVDAVWSRRFGRRKSWITPIQTISGFALIYLGSTIDDLMVAAGKDDGSGVWNFTCWWFFLVFLCATQDIAVDGWAISLLSMQNISYASTAQTVGLTAGSFMSHTVFLAFNSKDFANQWFRKTPQETGLMTLGGYMTFWGWGYLVVTVCLAIFKREEKTKSNDSIMDVYRSMWGILKLKPILSIILIHLIAKIGFITNDSVTNLKLLDKGFGQANLALVVLIDFPFEISLGYYAGKWSTQYTPLRLWCWAFVARLVAAVWAQITIMIYPSNPVPMWYMLVVIAEHIYSTFMSTVMFVAVSAFHARVADPAIGGTFMTMLATASNLGGTFPKIAILKLVDAFTKATCIPGNDLAALKAAGRTPITDPFSCALAGDKTRCEIGGGSCLMERDGYYITNIVFVILAAVLFWGYIERKALALQALPVRAWRVSSGGQGYTRVAG